MLSQLKMIISSMVLFKNWIRSLFDYLSLEISLMTELLVASSSPRLSEWRRVAINTSVFTCIKKRSFKIYKIIKFAAC